MATVAESLALAEQYYQTDQHAAAEQICRQIVEADPQQADALYLLGILACQAGRYAEATAHLQAAVGIRPDEARFHHGLGLVYFQQGCPQEAIACYQRALALQPALAHVHNDLANVYKSQGHTDEALACYDAALRLAPNFAEAHNNRGNLLKYLGRLAEAEASYQNAVRLRPDLPQPHYNLGLVLARQDRVSEAVCCYGEALRLWPAYAEAHIALGDVLTRASRLEQAEAHYRQALRLRPNVALVYNNLGIVLEVQARVAEEQATLGPRPGETRQRAEAEKKRAEAIACYEQALRIQPDYMDALSNLANGYLNQELGEGHFRQLGPEILATLYRAACQVPTDINEHCPTLYELARQCEHVTEMGTRAGNSTIALLFAQPAALVCYDKEKWHRIQVLEALAGRTSFRFHQADVLEVDIESTDLLFIDTWHVYEQLKQELARHGAKARKYIVLHDTTKFAERGEAPEHRGVWPAIEEFLQHGIFHLKQRFTNNNGLTILERVGRPVDVIN